MTQEIIDMARQAGMVYREFEDEFANANTDGVDLKTIEAFAKLAVAKEREACAKVCEKHGYDHYCGNVTDKIAETIRARGEAWRKQLNIPPQRTWVGLTDEEIVETSQHYTEAEGFEHGALWADEKLKDKNT